MVCEDELSISEEEEVYEAVMAWVKHDLSSRKCHFPDLLKCLRLFSMSKFSLRKILNNEELVKENPICTAILVKGLDFFLFLDQFLGRSPKHPTSIVKKEETVVVLTGGHCNVDYDAVSPDTYCFVLATKKWQSLCKMPGHSCCCEECISAVCGGRLYALGDTFERVNYFKPKKNKWKCTKFPTEFYGQLFYFAVTFFNEDLYMIDGKGAGDILQNVYKYNPICNE